MSSVIKHTVLSPFVTGTLLYILTRGPLSLREPLLRQFASSRGTARALRALKWLFALGLGRQINQWLNTWAANNWRWRDDVVWNWEEEVAVVTGGSNGIGALVVKGLAAKGIKVAVIDIQPLPKEVEDSKSHYPRHCNTPILTITPTPDPKITLFNCDITSPDSVQSIAQTITTTLGPPSILINNAGIAAAHTILTTSPEHLRTLFDVNLLSHFSLLHSFLPAMIAQNKGHVLTVASMASFVTCAGLVDYCASKAGALALHEGLGQELKHRYRAPGVRTSVVCPIYVNTGLIASYRESLRESGAVLIQPQTVADAVVRQVLGGRSGRVVLPGWMAGAAGARGWPGWVQELLRDSTAGDVKEVEGGGGT